MPSTASAGVLIYAKHLEEVSTFYERVLGARVLHADNEHKVLQAQDAQIIIHAIPAQYAECKRSIKYMVVFDPDLFDDSDSSLSGIKNVAGSEFMGSTPCSNRC